MVKGKKKELEGKKGRIISSLKRIDEFISNYRSPEEYYQIQFRIDEVKSLKTEYTSVSDELISLISREEEETDMNNEIILIEDMVFSLLGKLDSLFSSEKAKVAAPLPIVPLPQVSDSVDVSLPDIEIPSFDGNLRDWISFRDHFKSLFHDNSKLSNVRKMQYLRSGLKGQALDLISNLAITDMNYDIAWKLLLSRYDNDRLISQTHVLTLFNIPKLKNENLDDLRNLTNEFFKNIRFLESLGEQVESCDFILLPLLTSKLNSSLIKRWEQRVTSFKNSDKNKKLTLKDLESFLIDQINILEVSKGIFENKNLNNSPNTNQNKDPKNNSNFNLNKKYFNSSNPNQSVNKSYNYASQSKPENLNNNSRNHNSPSSQERQNKNKFQCHVCPEFHWLYQCPIFKSMTPQKRLLKVNEKKLCHNCFSKIHFSSACTNPGVCRTCFKKHNSLLHIDSNSEPIKEKTLCASTQSSTSVLLATAQVLISNGSDPPLTATALLDSAAQSNFISESFAKKLNCPRKSVNISVCGINQGSVSATDQITTSIKSRISDYSVLVNMLVLPGINKLPTALVPFSNWDLPVNIVLADPQFYKPHDIDLIIGASIFFDILSPEKFKLNNFLPIFQNTKFGWIVCGDYSNESPSINYLATNIPDIQDNPDKNTHLDSLLTKFWEIEKIPSVKILSAQDKLVEQLYEDTVSKDSSGRYIVHLPFKRNPNSLGNSSNLALKQFYSLERKFCKEIDLFKQYKGFIDEYLSLGHMIELQPHEYSTIHQSPNYFLPHHAVRRENVLTSKIRVVFNGSSVTTSGISLNDVLHIGPSLQQNSVPIILRFRTHELAVTADIEKMYRQILVYLPHTNFQLIYWRNSPAEKLKIYRLLTVTYGTAPAPYLAIKTLRKIALDNTDKFPLASKCILNDFFVDDVCSCVPSLAMLLELCYQLETLLSSAGMTLRKWCSNSKEFLSVLSNINPDPLYSLDLSSNNIKTLGVYWDPKKDSFHYEVNLPNHEVNTKRSVVSDVAKVYDPLGLLCPVVTHAKILIQSLWVTKVDWDDCLPPEKHESWIQFKGDLSSLNHFEIPRFVGNHKVSTCELHGFCDASQQAYGAAIYLKIISPEGCTVQLLTAKSRVAPVQSLSLPRLELCGALLLAQLYSSVVDSLSNVTVSSTHFWTDSTIVLHWLASEPSRWKTFVCNRVSEIQQISQIGIWHHVISCDNPADLITRGLLPSEFINQLSFWLHGPRWLQFSDYKYIPFIETPSLEVPESKIVTTTMVAVSSCDIPVNVKKYSSWLMLQRCFAYVRRAAANFKLSKDQRITGSLTLNEITESQNLIIKSCQFEMFPVEINCLKQNQPIPKSSRLLSLNPFLDKFGLLRVGGRLQNSSVSYNQAHPILLDPKHHLSKLIVKYYHICSLHSGPQSLLYRVRLNFWPLNGLNLCKLIFRNCVICFKVKPKPLSYLMGNLPVDRVNPTYPFITTGMDFAGPILIKQSLRKNSPVVKCYICIFVCMVTKAIHLEPVSDLTSESFIASLRRFVARRGKVKTLYCDNGRNFVGANATLKELGSMISTNTFQDKIKSEASCDEINFKFIPSKSPVWGGLWESGVKSMKYHLRRTMGLVHYTFEELATVLAQIESQLNSRPLMPMSSEHTSFNVLTPSHFLIGRPSSVIPDSSPQDPPKNLLKRWQLMQHIHHKFWNQWSREYLGSLQQRGKWRTKGPSVQPGILVLVKEDNLPPLRWSLARITQVHPGSDGVTRAATIQFSNGSISRRVLGKLCPLPIYEESNLEKGDVQV